MKPIAYSIYFSSFVKQRLRRPALGSVYPHIKKKEPATNVLTCGFHRNLFNGMRFVHFTICKAPIGGRHIEIRSALPVVILPDGNARQTPRSKTLQMTRVPVGNGECSRHLSATHHASTTHPSRTHLALITHSPLVNQKLAWVAG